jgi:hypothetical protein
MNPLRKSALRCASQSALFLVAAILLVASSVGLLAQPIISLSLEDGGSRPLSIDPEISGSKRLPPLPADYSQDFDTYLGTAATVPVGWSVSFTGTANFGGTNAGGSSTGAAYAYGTGSDFAFGALHTGTTGLITLAVAFINDTGSTLTSLTIQWNYEQWRFSNTSGFDLTGTGALASNAIVNSADFVGSSTGTSGTPSSTPISLTLSGFSIAPGDAFGLSWTTTDATGSDNGIAIDDFAISAGSPIPEPATIAMVALGAGLLVGIHRFRCRFR